MPVVGDRALIRGIGRTVPDRDLSRLALLERDRRFLPESRPRLEITPADTRLGLRLRALRVHVFEFQFRPVRADRVTFEIDLGAAGILYLRFRPPFDWEKEILVDLAAGVLHPV